MDYEKLHRDTISKLQQMVNSGKIAVEDARGICADFVPESEDEQIRKRIIQALHGDVLDMEETTRATAWLEKQGENHIVDNNEMVKPIDKVEPKFKVGDKIRCKLDDRTFVIKEVDLEKGEYLYTKSGCGNDINYADETFELVEQKPAWSEEDDNCLSTIIAEFSKCAGKSVSKDEWMRCNDFLNSLKGRVLPQPKQEWKQENTDDLTDFENAMMHIGGSFFGENAGLDPNDTNTIKEQANLLLELVPKQEWSEDDEYCRNQLIVFCENCMQQDSSAIKCANWLKSLRPQNRWKPSEGQLECLGYAIEKAEKDWSPLINNRIYLTLKALKEQLLELMGSKV